MNYYAYIQSEEWAELRSAKLLESNHRCEECGRRTKLQVHHKTYERLGCERLTDLTVLCEGCHEKAHNLFAYRAPDEPIVLDEKQQARIQKANAIIRRIENTDPHPLFKYVKPLGDGDCYKPKPSWR